MSAEDKEPKHFEYLVELRWHGGLALRFADKECSINWSLIERMALAPGAPTDAIMLARLVIAIRDRTYVPLVAPVDGAVDAAVSKQPSLS